MHFGRSGCKPHENARAAVAGDIAVLDKIEAVARADRNAGAFIVRERAAAHGDVVGANTEEEATFAVPLALTIFEQCVRTP